jgi:hypothetical protein
LNAFRISFCSGVSDSDVGLDLLSVFHNDMHFLNLDDGRWFPFDLVAPAKVKGKKTQDRFRERMAQRTKLDGFAEVGGFEVRICDACVKFHKFGFLNSH